MKFLTPTIALFALCSSFSSAEELSKNGTMDSNSGWRGDKTIETVDGNKVLLVKANSHKPASFYQNVSTRGVKDVIVKFRYKSDDYKGRGLTLRAMKGNGSTFSTMDLTVDGQWHDSEWRFSEVDDSANVTFSFEVLEGDGKIYFDDVSIASN